MLGTPVLAERIMLGPIQEPKVKPGCGGNGTRTSQSFGAQTEVPLLSFCSVLSTGLNQ